MTTEERLTAIEQYISVLKEQGYGMPDLTAETLIAMTDGEIATMLNKTTFPEPNHEVFPDSYLTELIPRRITDGMSLVEKFRCRDRPKGYPLCPQCARPLVLEGQHAACPVCRDEYLKNLDESGLSCLLRNAQKVMFGHIGQRR